jgi:hypothetical protein
MKLCSLVLFIVCVAVVIELGSPRWTNSKRKISKGLKTTFTTGSTFASKAGGFAKQKFDQVDQWRETPEGDFITGMIPFSPWVAKDVITGRGPDGEKLSTSERLFSAASLIPQAKVLKGAQYLGKGVKAFRTMRNTGRTGKLLLSGQRFMKNDAYFRGANKIANSGMNLYNMVQTGWDMAQQYSPQEQTFQQPDMEYGPQQYDGE